MVSWVAMITTVFFICNYGSRHKPQAQYKRWMYITGLYDPTGKTHEISQKLFPNSFFFEIALFFLQKNIFKMKLFSSNHILKIKPWDIQKSNHFFPKETHESFETHFSFVFLKLDFLYKNYFKKKKRVNLVHLNIFGFPPKNGILLYIIKNKTLSETLFHIS